VQNLAQNGLWMLYFTRQSSGKGQRLFKLKAFQVNAFANVKGCALGITN
jgi:hypothetical protein